MALIGYHASHEQFTPSQLLGYIRAAEEAGFRAAMSSDHFAPWGREQAESGFAWAWLGSALATTNLSFGTVTSPIGLRYHPALIAQAAATLAEMFTGRIWIAVGSGEALNERPFGFGWPAKSERNARLLEGVEIIRALWAGEEVTRSGIIGAEEVPLHSPRKVACSFGGSADARYRALGSGMGGRPHHDKPASARDAAGYQRLP